MYSHRFSQHSVVQVELFTEHPPIAGVHILVGSDDHFGEEFIFEAVPDEAVGPRPASPCPL